MLHLLVDTGLGIQRNEHLLLWCGLFDIAVYVSTLDVRDSFTSIHARRSKMSPSKTVFWDHHFRNLVGHNVLRLVIILGHGLSGRENVNDIPSLPEMDRE